MPLQRDHIQFVIPFLCVPFQYFFVLYTDTSEQSRSYQLSLLVKQIQEFQKDWFTTSSWTKWLKKTQTAFVPELKMHLLTPEDKLWHEKWEEGGQSEEPFWAIFWPGGQVLSRFLLDTQKARNKRGDFLLRKLDSFQLQFKIQCWILDVDAVPKALPHCKAEPKFLWHLMTLILTH